MKKGPRVYLAQLFEKTTVRDFFVTLIVIAFIASSAVLLRAAEPAHKFIAMQFFKCEKSKNLQGGIYGKGPLRKFGPRMSECRKDEWVEITKQEFKILATKWYGYDWSKETPFWTEDSWADFLTERDQHDN